MPAVVYFIQSGDGGSIKIGTTKGDPIRRLSDMQTGSPHALRLLGVVDGGVDVERDLHSRFADAHDRLEWFHPTEGLLAFIRDRATPWARQVRAKRLGFVDRVKLRRAEAEARRQASVYRPPPGGCLDPIPTRAQVDAIMMQLVNLVDLKPPPY